MSFINKKEDVIDIELTQHGKELLARGSFKPAYYAFFDDDIIYDVKYAATAEHQNNAEKRIKDAIRLNSVHTAMGAESRNTEKAEKVKEGLASEFEKINKYTDHVEREKLLQYPLCNIELGSQKSPHFLIQSLGSKIKNTGNVNYLTQSYTPAKIPQLNIDAQYELKVNLIPTNESNNDMIDDEVFIDLMSSRVEFLDGTTVEVEEENILIDIQEFNVPYREENFELEIFVATRQNGSNEEIFVPLEDHGLIEGFFEINIDNSIEGANIEKDNSKNYYGTNSKE